MARKAIKISKDEGKIPNEMLVSDLFVYLLDIIYRHTYSAYAAMKEKADNAKFR